MRGFIVMAMFAMSLSHAGSQYYSEVRDFNLDADGLTEFFIDAGAGALVVNGIEGGDEIVVIATILVDTDDEEEARRLLLLHGSVRNVLDHFPGKDPSV